jgi:hypothetical protein
MDSTVLLAFHLLYVAVSTVYVMYSITYDLMDKIKVGYDNLSAVTMKSTIF